MKRRLAFLIGSLSIRTKILLACLCLTAVTIGFGVVSRDAQSTLGAMAGRLYDETFMSMSYLRSAQNGILTVAHAAETGDFTPDEFDARLGDALGDLEVARARSVSTRGRDIAAELTTAIATIADAYREFRTLPDRARFAELERRFDTAVEINAGDGYHSRLTAAELTRRLAAQSSVAMLLSVGCALAITLVLSRAIVPAVKHAVRIATAIASGRLDNAIQANGTGETEVLLQALDTMQASIADKIGQIEALLAQQALDHASEMEDQHARFETALENMVQGLCMFDSEGRVLVHNRRFEEMFGAAPPGTQAADALPGILLASADEAAMTDARMVVRTLEDERTISVAERVMPGGGWVATYEDITERHRIEARMAFMARHDALTGLPNRVLFHDQMRHFLNQIGRGGDLAVLCLDLDHFKSVNDTLGHSVGDELLCAVAQRLLGETRDTDTVVRLGGDEFAIIQPFAKPIEASALAERLIECLSTPFLIDDHHLAIGTSIGIALASDGLNTADALLKSADLALYRAKADGRGTFRFFEAEMDARLQARRLLELDMRRGIAEGQFENFYQALISVDTKEVAGFEALVRWRHPTKGMVSPGEFIPIAEETGLIAQIGLEVLERACRDALTWPEHVKVAVNLSPLQFRNRNLPAEIADALRRSGLAPARLELEITESILLQDSEVILGMLNEIKSLGVFISMDDFGTGYSSLSYLRRFPFDKIKIDQSFIRNIVDSADCMAIVRTVLGLGRSLGMRVIAEGVETEEQFAALENEGCEQVQGYFFSRPVPASFLHDLLQGGERRAA